MATADASLGLARSNDRAWRERSERLRYLARVGPLVAFTGVFLLGPLVALFLYSFGTSTFVELSFGTRIENYGDALSNPLYRELLTRAVVNGTITAAVCVLLAFPFAYAITLGPLRRHGELFLLAVLVTLFSSYVVRIYAWRTLLGDSGVVNQMLDAVGVGPADFLLYSRPAVVMTLVNVLVPLAVLPIYSALAQVDPSLIEGARDLGATRWQAIRRIVLPLAMRGVNAAFAVCLIIAAGDYVTPQLVGGADGQMIGNVINDQFGVAFNWPLGSALAFILLLLSGVVFGLWLLLTRVLGLRGVAA